MKKAQNKKVFAGLLYIRDRVFFVALICGVVTGLIARPAYGQSLQRKITLKIADMAVTDALHEANRLCGNRIIFMKEEVDREKARVTLDVTERPMLEVVEKIIAATSLTCVEKDGRVVVTPKKQQEMMLRGVVKDADGAPLPGVTVAIKGVSIGVVTDAEGKYLLRLPETKGIRLIFSFVGMKTQEIVYTGQSEIDVTLHEEAISMAEVVVTGYQMIDKRKNTSSVTTVKMDDIMVPGATSLDQMLEGRVPDMILMNNSGEVGVAPKIRIRGTSTLIGNREPLWVLDGVVMQDPVAVSAEELNDPDYVTRIGNAIAGINPQDIERIDVLKDASATALYGVKAANGVIVVTTKKGRIGKPQIRYNVTTTFRQRPRYSDRKIDLMNSKERIRFSRELVESHYEFGTINYVGYEGALRDLWNGVIDDKQFAEKVAWYETVNTDWFKLLTEDTWSHQHTVSMSGGSRETRYYASVGYTRDNDVIKDNYNQRYTATLNVESSLASWLTASFNLSGNVSNKEYSQLSPMNYAYNSSRAIPAYDENGDYFFYERRANKESVFKYNILNELDDSYKKQYTSGITLTANLQFAFASWLNANAIVSYTNQNAEIEGYWGEKTNYVAKLRNCEYGDTPTKYSQLPYGGELRHNETRNKSYMVRLQLNANRYFGVDNQHNLAFSGGFEMNSTQYNEYGRVDRGYYPDRGKTFVELLDQEKFPAYLNWLASKENLPTLTENLTNMLSGYASLSYSFHNYLTLNVNARIDGSNKFGDQSNDKLLPIWSASGNWNLTEHEWMKCDWLNELSLKTSFGYQGNMLDSESPVMIVKKLPINTYYNQMAAKVERYPNPDLKWEKTASYNLGLSLALFQNRIQVEAEYYNKQTKDAFMTCQVASVNGRTSYMINGGDIENKGYNVDIAVTPVKTKDWRWTFSTSFSQNYNKVKSRPDADTYDYLSFLNGTSVVKNKAINSFYSYDFIGLSPIDGGPMFNDMYENKQELTGLNKYETFTRVLKLSGRREPYMSGGLSTSLRYKQLRMSAMFSYALGAKTRLFRMFNKNLSPENNVHRDFLKRWRLPGDEKNTNIPALISPNESGYYRYNRHWSSSGADGVLQIQKFAGDAWEMYDFSDARVVSANYLKCSSLRFSYEFSNELLSKMKLSRLELSLSGTNLFTLSSKKLKGQTPTQGGFSEIQLSERPTYTLGLTVLF